MFRSVLAMLHVCGSGRRILGVFKIRLAFCILGNLQKLCKCFMSRSACKIFCKADEAPLGNLTSSACWAAMLAVCGRGQQILGRATLGIFGIRLPLCMLGKSAEALQSTLSEDGGGVYMLRFSQSVRRASFQYVSAVPA